jgi:hypothetical protein
MNTTRVNKKFAKGKKKKNFDRKAQIFYLHARWAELHLK